LPNILNDKRRHSYADAAKRCSQDSYFIVTFRIR
jgi:hypothetical protein